MYRQIGFLLHLFVLHLSLAEQQPRSDVPASPCPQIFQYKFNGNDWFGEIILPSPPIQHREVVLHLTLSLRAATAQNNVGQISIAHSPQEATNRIINGEPLTFHVTFPYHYPIPKVVRIIYDENLMCTGPEEQPNPTTPISRIDLKHVMHTFATNTPQSSINNIYNPDQSNKPNYTPIHNNYPMQPSSSYPSNNQYPTGLMPPSMLPPYFIPVYPTTPSTTTTTTTTTTTSRPVYESRPQPHQPPRPQTDLSQNELDSVCGTRYQSDEVIPFIFGGEDTKRGEWPWMVAVYVNKPTGLKFVCGGSLISTKSVITAAHCMNTPTKIYRPHEVVLYLGRYSLIDWSEVGSIATNVEEIIVHSDYKRQRESYDADIAILIMTKRVEFNEFVRPVCLGPATSTSQDIEGKKGTVVGWGKDGSEHVVSNIPKKVDLPIVNSITCVQTSESLSKAISNRTFCAGTLDGDGPCHGDSGGGLTLYENQRWLLRGIVSTGLADPNTGICKLMDYVVFTDVSTFSIWIKTNIKL